MVQLNTVLVFWGEQQGFNIAIPSIVEKTNKLINSSSTELWFINDHQHVESYEWLKKLKWKTKILVSDPEITQPSDAQVIEVLSTLIRERKPKAIILPACDRTNKLVTKLGLALGVGSLLNVSDIEFQNGRFLLRRRIFGGNLFGTFKSSSDLLICTLAIEQTNKEIVEKFTGECQLLMKSWPEMRGLRIIRNEEKKIKKQELSISDAEIVVVAGRGLGSRNNVCELGKLANLLGAEIGGTRPVIANGWLPRFRLIGISGNTIKPKICLVFGASGATPFILGIDKSQKIIGINNEKEAMLFNICDVGVVAECNQLIQSLIDQIRSNGEL